MSTEMQIVVQIASIFIALVGGVGSVPVIEWFKAKFELGARYTQLVVAIVSTLLGVALLIVQGILVPEAMTPENISTLFLAVLMAGQAEYARIKRQMEG